MRLLYLVPRWVFLNKMSRIRFHQIEEISKNCEVKYSGLGWDNYDSKKTVKENVKKIYQGDAPDALIAFDHYSLLEFKKCRIPKITMMNEMHSPDGDKFAALEMLGSGGYDLIICHHKNEMMSPVFNKIRNKLINIPHHVNTSIFKDYNLEKNTDVLLCGSHYLEKYKLRKRFIKIIKNLKQLGLNAKVHPFPSIRPNEACKEDHILQFAKAINSSKICLTCSSIYKCAFAKYVEIPMCKSLIAGDIPDERQDFFKSFVLELNEKQTDKEMIQSIVNILKDKNKLQEITLIGQEKNKIFSMENYAKIFLKELKKFLIKKF